MSQPGTGRNVEFNVCLQFIRSFLIWTVFSKHFWLHSVPLTQLCGTLNRNHCKSQNTSPSKSLEVAAVQTLVQRNQQLKAQMMELSAKRSALRWVHWLCRVSWLRELDRTKTIKLIILLVLLHHKVKPRCYLLWYLSLSKLQSAYLL